MTISTPRDIRKIDPLFDTSAVSWPLKMIKKPHNNWKIASKTIQRRLILDWCVSPIGHFSLRSDNGIASNISSPCVTGCDPNTALFCIIRVTPRPCMGHHHEDQNQRAKLDG